MKEIVDGRHLFMRRACYANHYTIDVADKRKYNLHFFSIAGWLNSY
jgi:hypothetical protein